MINADYFRIAQRFTRSDHPTRPDLAGVLIEPHAAGGVIIVGVSGEIACAIWDPLGYSPVPMCVRVETGGDWSEFTGDAILTFVGPTATIQNGAQYPYESFDSFKYPKWRTLFPDGGLPLVDKRVALDLRLLDRFALTGEVNPIQVWAHERGGMTPQLVTHEKYPTFIGCIMPYQSDARHMLRRPAWLD